MLHDFNPAPWGELLRASVSDIGGGEFWLAALQIVFVNVLLSGDNAVVIAMACRGLPPRQRFWGLAIGAGVAVVLLITFTTIIGRLMLMPYLKLLAGLALIYVAAKLLAPERDDKNEVEAAAHLWRAVRIVVIADIVMSLDNIIAIAAVAKGNLALLVIGLTVSIPIVIAGSALIMALLNRLPVLIWAGAALLGWIAGGVIATDPAVLRYVSATIGAPMTSQVEFAASGAVALLVIGLGGLWRTVSLNNTRAAASGDHSAGS
jgi:YjbE family integral membrane protein